MNLFVVTSRHYGNARQEMRHDLAKIAACARVLQKPPPLLELGLSSTFGPSVEYGYSKYTNEMIQLDLEAYTSVRAVVKLWVMYRYRILNDTNQEPYGSEGVRFV